MPHSSNLSTIIEEETRYQGRGLRLEYKPLRSEYCDMDRLHSHLKASKVSLVVIIYIKNCLPNYIHYY